MVSSDAYHIFTVTVLFSAEYLYAYDMVQMCTYNSATRNRSTARFTLNNINYDLCTHYVFSHANVDFTSRTIQAVESADEGTYGQYMALNNKKLTFTTIKTLLSVGSSHIENHEAYELIVQTETLIRTFAQNALTFLRQRKFDGMVVDWPTSYNKVQLSNLLKFLNVAFTDEGLQTRRPRLLLDIKCPGNTANVRAGFDGERISWYADHALLTTYDMVLPNTLYATFGSALFGMRNPVVLPDLSVNATVSYYANDSVPYSMMIVGIRAAGRYLRLASRHNNTVGSPVTNEVLSGGVHSIRSMMTYPEACLMISAGGTRYFDNVQKSPYVVHGDQWVGYEDKQSIEHKIRWLMSLGMAGIIIHSMDEDDVSGTICREGRYPLLNCIQGELGLRTTPRTTPRPAQTAPPAQTTTVSSAQTTDSTQHTGTTDFSIPDSSGISTSDEWPGNTQPDATDPLDNPDITTRRFISKSKADFSISEVVIVVVLILLFVLALCLIISLLLLRKRTKPRGGEGEVLPTGAAAI